MSISPTFYEQVLHQNPFAKKLQTRIVSKKLSYEKTAFKILVKLTPDNSEKRKPKLVKFLSFVESIGAMLRSLSRTYSLAIRILVWLDGVLTVERQNKTHIYLITLNLLHWGKLRPYPQ